MTDSHVSIGLIKPKSPSNVGAVMRAANCFSADAIFYTGERYERAARFQTDTKNATLTLPLTGVENLLDQVDCDTRVVCVELAEGATPLPEYRHPDKAMYVFGPEDGTLDQVFIDQADDVVYVPTVGCLNLAATVNVVLYDRLAKLGLAHGGDELIRQSRDTNNRVSVKRDTD